MAETEFTRSGRDPGGWDADVTPEGVAAMRERAAGAMRGQEWETVRPDGMTVARAAAEGWGEV